MDKLEYIYTENYSPINVIHQNGSVKSYKPIADNDAARGNALQSAIMSTGVGMRAQAAKPPKLTITPIKYLAETSSLSIVVNGTTYMFTWNMSLSVAENLQQMWNGDTGYSVNNILSDIATITHTDTTITLIFGQNDEVRASTDDPNGLILVQTDAIPEVAGTGEGYRRCWIDYATQPSVNDSFTAVLGGSDTEEDLVITWEFIAPNGQPIHCGARPITIGSDLADTKSNIRSAMWVSLFTANGDENSPDLTMAARDDEGTIFVLKSNNKGYSHFSFNVSKISGWRVIPLEWVRTITEPITIALADGIYDSGRLSLPAYVSLKAVNTNKVAIKGGINITSNSTVEGVNCDSTGDINTYLTQSGIYVSAWSGDIDNIVIQNCKSNAICWAVLVEGIGKVEKLQITNNQLTSSNPIFIRGVECIAPKICNNELRKLASVASDQCHSWIDIGQDFDGESYIAKSRDAIIKDNYGIILDTAGGGYPYGWNICGYGHIITDNNLVNITGDHIMGFGDAIAVDGDTLRPNKIYNNSLSFSAASGDVWAVDVTVQGTSNPITQAAPIELGSNIIRGYGTFTPKRIRINQTSLTACVVTILPNGLNGWNAASNTDSLTNGTVTTWVSP